MMVKIVIYCSMIVEFNIQQFAATIRCHECPTTVAGYGQEMAMDCFFECESRLDGIV